MAEEKDYHGKQNYVMILGLITVLLAGMVGAALTMTGSTKVILISVLGAVQFYVVLSNLMHLKYEPALIDLFVYLGVACIIIWFFGVYPDSVMIPLTITQ